MTVLVDVPFPNISEALFRCGVYAYIVAGLCNCQLYIAILLCNGRVNIELFIQT